MPRMFVDAYQLSQQDREAYEDYCENVAERRADDFVPVDDFDPIPW
ncbi:hypothetical protein KNU62_gp57 [Gordonia phage Bakery]|uniref:Uncharacterized protein n=1 Tax=Gordonia phage Bakery TaxID=2591205 RepID=A0A514DGW4_9CAUD|nr:hypothetical protein KNU62_gp57 [Gordonia phage Bakery]QDH92842.1 hypothetical protein SEA_BAKERY_57 [Gordonia phage Bakery]